jgi:hypothetical protein
LITGRNRHWHKLGVDSVAAIRELLIADFADTIAGRPGIVFPRQLKRRLQRRGDARAAMFETSLYPPVKRFLEAAGFVAKGEVKSCDIVAVWPGEPLTLELKLGLTLELLFQVTDRTRMADEVWPAVPATRRGQIGMLASIVSVVCWAWDYWRSAPRGTRRRYWSSRDPISRGAITAGAAACYSNMRGDAEIRLPAARPSNRS